MQVVGTTTKPQFSDKNKQTIVAFLDTVNNAQKAVIRLEKREPTRVNSLCRKGLIKRKLLVKLTKVTHCLSTRA